MGPILSILLALGALALREYGVESGWRAPWIALPLALAPYFVAAQARGAALRGKFKASERWQRVLTLAPAACFALAVCGAGWASFIEGWIGRPVSFFEWPRFEALLVLAPFALYEAAAIDARVRLVAHGGAARGRLRAFQLRLFAAALLPLVAFVLVSAAVGSSESWRVRIEEVGLWHTLYAGVLLLALLVALPFVLAFTLDTQRVGEGPLRQLLEAVAARAGFRSRGVYLWNTGGNMANAAIVGLGARTRIVLLSDLLLELLDGRELAAVFAHEIAHARRRHVPVFAAWVLAFFLGGDLLARSLFPGEEWLAASVLLAALGAWFLFFGWLSRRCELEADLFASELLGDPGAIVSALERVGGQLRDVASWRHFSTARRVAFLERAAADPRFARRFQRKLKLLARLGVLSCAAVLALEGWRLVGERGNEELRADLRLGRYDQARERLDALARPDAELARLVARTRALEGGSVEIDELERAARAALLADEFQAGVELLELAALRGRAELGELARALLAPEEHALDPELARSWAAELAHASRLAPRAPRDDDRRE